MVAIYWAAQLFKCATGTELDYGLMAKLEALFGMVCGD
jgi:hypothetical protein